jgi:hypothetical protein
MTKASFMDVARNVGELALLSVMVVALSASSSTQRLRARRDFPGFRKDHQSEPPASGALSDRT